ncbi:helix-turn-helix domain-containing protein [uncultured Campylobacter sp.]|mgnify:CR=1 FL=1|jgi:repressor|uniref:helix-turn-helix domain-containing protein n=1 Tax=uncultured Campylobacter sp. TaxID=218934 RepID=UPI002067FBDF|nr:helix-turn-helix transcriptional regulator [uncultured Campylobacter sp.]DAT36036.1 MAG TPA: helix-turn-helix domain protein [Caudoviricetes sp.]
MKENVINLKEVRDKIGLTQKETADKLGISLRTYQRYELDGDGIDYKKLLEISKKLGVSMEQLTGAVAIGSGNIAIRGNGNQIDKQRSQKRNTPLYIEFEKLYDDYGNETLLKGFVEKLKKLKEFSEE